MFCSGNVVGTFLRMCPAHRRAAPSARDWRELKIVYCFLPSRVTSSPERPASPARDSTISASDASAEQTSQDESASREGRTVIRRRLFPPTMPSYENLIDAIHEQDSLDLQRNRDTDRDIRSRPARSYGVDVSSSPSWDSISFPTYYSQQFSGLFPAFPHGLSNRPISPFNDHRHAHSRFPDPSEDPRSRAILTHRSRPLHPKLFLRLPRMSHSLDHCPLPSQPVQQVPTTSIRIQAGTLG